MRFSMRGFNAQGNEMAHAECNYMVELWDAWCAFNSKFFSVTLDANLPAFSFLKWQAFVMCRIHAQTNFNVGDGGDAI
jgi:hypothetical protein